MDWYEDVVKLLVCMLEVYMMFELFDNVTNTREVLSKRWIACTCLVTTVLLFIINAADNDYVNLIGFPILSWFFVTVVFEMNIWRRVFYFVITYSITMVCEFLYVVLVKISTHITSDERVPPLSDNLLQLIIIKFLTYIAYTIVIHISSRAKNNMPSRIFLMYLCLPAATLGMMLTVFYSGVNFQDNLRQRVLMTIFIMLMLLGNILIYYAFNKYSEEVYANSRHEFIIMKQRDELMHLQESSLRNERHQELIHDTGNYLLIIKKLIASGENERAGHVLTDLNKELEKNVMTVYSEHMVLNTLLSEKADMAERQQVAFDAYVEPYLNLDHIKDMDLISMLGNLIDNAVRGAGECADHREIRVRIFMQNEGNVLVAKIENNCLEDIPSDTEELKSTKKEKGLHGLGIKSVVRTAEQYDGYLEYYVENKIFTAILVLPAIE